MNEEHMRSRSMAAFMRTNRAELEPLEPRTLLSLLVNNPVADVAVGAGAGTVSVSLNNVFDDDQTAVEIRTSQGNFDVLLYDSLTPLTVANFLQYVTNGIYDNTIIHRSIADFVIQGGGYDADTLLHIATYAAVQNEPGISNIRGTIAMAKLPGDPNSATSEWFVNLVNNSANLDSQNGGFTVFGYVINDGMDVVDAIAALNTQDMSGVDPALTHVPVDDSGDPIVVGVGVIPKLDPGHLSWITLSIVGNTNPDLVDVSLNGTDLDLTFAPGQIGSSTITLRATDMLGNTIDSSFHVSASQLTVNDLTTADSSPVITGLVGANPATLEVTVDGTTYTLANGDIVLAGTAWSLQLPVLPDGVYQVDAAATDQFGNPASSTGQLIIDTVAPTVAIDAGQLPVSINANTTLTGTFIDDHIGGVAITLDDGAGGTFHFDAIVDAGAGTWSADILIAGMPDGIYSVRATATDMAGLEGSADGDGLLTVDATAPTVTATSLTTKNRQPALTGTVDDPAATVTVTINGQTPSTTPLVTQGPACDGGVPTADGQLAIDGTYVTAGTLHGYGGAWTALFDTKALSPFLVSSAFVTRHSATPARRRLCLSGEIWLRPVGSALGSEARGWANS